MDDKARKAEELLEERLRTRTNGETHGAVADAEPEAPATPAKVEELTNDLKRMAADFSNYRKRNDAERIEFAKFAKADLIAKLLDVLDGYDRALATVPDEVKGQPWVEGMWLVERKLRSVLESEGLEPIDSLGTAIRSVPASGGGLHRLRRAGRHRHRRTPKGVPTARPGHPPSVGHGR